MSALLSAINALSPDGKFLCGESANSIADTSGNGNNLSNDTDNPAVQQAGFLNGAAGSNQSLLLSGQEFNGNPYSLQSPRWFLGFFQPTDGGGGNPILTNGNFGDGIGNSGQGLMVVYGSNALYLVGADGTTSLAGSFAVSIGAVVAFGVQVNSSGGGIFFAALPGGTAVQVGTAPGGSFNNISGGNFTVGGDGQTDDTGGGYQYVFTGPGAGLTLSVFQNISNLAGLPASQLVFNQQPSNGWVSSPIAPAITVDIENPLGSVAPSSANVTISIASGSGTLSGQTTVAAVDGVATFGNLSINAAGSFTLSAASSGLTGATSNSFSISAATKLGFGQQPTGAFRNAAILPAITVLIQNSSGTTDPDSTANVTISIASGSGTLLGTTTVAAVAGVATFSDLSINAGGTFTLAATCLGLSGASSSSFVISAAAKVVFATSIPLSGADPYFYPALEVFVQTAGGVTVANDASTVTLSVAGGPGTIGGQTAVAAVAGVATFNFLTFSASGVYTLTASDGNLASATSNSFFIQVADNQLMLVSGDGVWSVQPARGLTFADPNTLCLLNHQSNSGSGTAAPDATGNNVVTITGTPTLAANPISPANFNAQALSGTSQYITIAPTLNLAAQPTWSFSVLFSVNGTLSGTQYLCRQNYSTGDVVEGIFGGDASNLSFALTASGASQSGFGSIPAPQTFDGSGVFSWKNSGLHCYTLTWDGQYFAAYFDGQLVGTYLAAGNLTGSPSSGFCLGAYPGGSNCAPVTFYCTEFRKDVLAVEQHIQRWKQFKTPTRTAYTRLNQKLFSTLSSGQIITEEGTWDTRSSKGNYTLYATANNGSGTSVIQRFTCPDLTNWSAGTTVLGNGVGGIPSGVAVYRSRWKMFPGSSTIYIYFRRSDAPQNLYVAISGDGGNTYAAQSTPVVSSAGQQFDGCESSDVILVNGTYWMRLEADVSGWGGVSKGFVLSSSTANGTFTVANGGNPLNSLMQYPGAAFGCRPSMYAIGSKIIELGHFAVGANNFGPTVGALAVIDASAIGTDSYQFIHGRLAPLKRVNVWPLEAVQVADLSLLQAFNSDGTTDCILVCTGGTTYNESSLEFFVARNCTLNQLFGVDNNPSPVSVSVNRQLGRARMVA
ncbi:MAG: hypothetical protein ABSF29_04545 [Tepidisphaeraceae bacterium]|jgi:hypothetical protein